MSLTLHNLRMIDKGYLPIHGAMVNIVLNNGKTANVVIMGDSGAGKSESIEAFRALSEDYISEMTVIFDDMGTFKIKNDKIYGYGTEIGAFVRLDDLDAGYSFKELDWSVFMNPDKVNARIVIPITEYKDVVAKHDVDMFLYANNYEEDGDSLSFFDNVDDALKVLYANGKFHNFRDYWFIGSKRFTMRQSSTSHSSMVPVCDEKLAPTLCRWRLSTA